MQTFCKKQAHTDLGLGSCQNTALSFERRISCEMFKQRDMLHILVKQNQQWKA